jgi:Zn-dependent peptidase ImmA (M78 family)/transcriptional regulator with XRE-family HTH domain
MQHVLNEIDPRALGAKLKQARTARGLKQEEVAEKLGMVRTTLVAIEQGTRRIKAKELTQLASLYGRSLGEWLGEESLADEPLVPQFRLPPQIKKLTEAEVRDSVEQLDSLAHDYFSLEQMNSTKLPRRYPAPYAFEISGVSADLRGEEVAAEERIRLGLGDGPIANLRALLEDGVGIRIFYLDLPSAVGGIYAFNEKLGACIAINRKHPRPRALWSLAHEYGHFLSTRFMADISLWDEEPWGKQAAERFADSFAKNFLMPRTGVNRLLTEAVRVHGKGVTVADVMTVSHHYQVSAEAMFRRLEELKRLPFGTWDGLKNRGFQADQARQALGLVSSSNKESRLPFRYRTLALIAYDRLEELTEAELAHFLRTDRVGARLELDALRGWADSHSDQGFEPVMTNPNEVLTPA